MRIIRLIKTKESMIYNIENKKIIPKKRLIGFMKGEIQYPDDIHAGDDEVLAMFEESYVNDELLKA